MLFFAIVFVLYFHLKYISIHLLKWASFEHFSFIICLPLNPLVVCNIQISFFIVDCSYYQFFYITFHSFIHIYLIIIMIYFSISCFHMYSLAFLFVFTFLLNLLSCLFEFHQIRILPILFYLVFSIIFLHLLWILPLFTNFSTLWRTFINVFMFLYNFPLFSFFFYSYYLFLAVFL